MKKWLNYASVSISYSVQCLTVCSLWLNGLTTLNSIKLSIEKKLKTTSISISISANYVEFIISNNSNGIFFHFNDFEDNKVKATLEKYLNILCNFDENIKIKGVKESQAELFYDIFTINPNLNIYFE